MLKLLIRLAIQGIYNRINNNCIQYAMLIPIMLPVIHLTSIFNYSLMFRIILHAFLLTGHEYVVWVRVYCADILNHYQL